MTKDQRKKLFAAPVRATKKSRPKPIRNDVLRQVYVPFQPFKVEGTTTFRTGGDGPSPNMEDVPRE